MDKAEAVFEKIAENLGLFKGTLEAERARTGGKKYPFIKFRSKDYYKNVVLPDVGTALLAEAPGAAMMTAGAVKGKAGLATAGLAALYAGLIGAKVKNVKRDQKWLAEHGIKKNFWGTKFSRE